MAVVETAVLAQVRADGLITSGAPVVVLLSGGRDSVCLLDVAVTLAGRDATTALHVNYGLRDEAEDDERYCTGLCERLGVRLTVVCPARTERGNVQAWAREVRYAEALRRAAQRDAIVAVGHTLTDQAETVLYRLSASPGRRALLGMLPREGRIVRPLLELSREQTAAHCRARDLEWREDASNASPLYARARVRHALLPALRAIHPAAEANVVRTARLLREEAEVLDELVAGALEDRDEIALARLRELPPALGRLVLRRLAEDALGRLVPRASARLEDVLALRGDAALDLGDGARAHVAAGVLRVIATPRLQDRVSVPPGH